MRYVSYEDTEARYTLERKGSDTKEKEKKSHLGDLQAPSDPGSEPTKAPKSHHLYVRSLQCTMCTLFSIFFRATEQAQTYLKI